MFFIELLTVTFLIVLVSAILMVRYGYAPSPFLGQYMSDENDLNRKKLKPTFLTLIVVLQV